MESLPYLPQARRVRSAPATRRVAYEAPDELPGPPPHRRVYPNQDGSASPRRSFAGRMTRGQCFFPSATPGSYHRGTKHLRMSGTAMPSRRPSSLPPASDRTRSRGWSLSFWPRIGKLPLEENQRVATHIAAVHVAHSTLTEEAFRALLAFQPIGEGVLISVIDALSEVATALSRSGESRSYRRAVEGLAARGPQTPSDCLCRRGRPTHPLRRRLSGSGTGCLCPRRGPWARPLCAAGTSWSHSGTFRGDLCRLASSVESQDRPWQAPR